MVASRTDRSGVLCRTMYRAIWMIGSRTKVQARNHSRIIPFVTILLRTSPDKTIYWSNRKLPSVTPTQQTSGLGNAHHLRQSMRSAAPREVSAHRSSVHSRNPASASVMAWIQATVVHRISEYDDYFDNSIKGALFVESQLIVFFLQ